MEAASFVPVLRRAPPASSASRTRGGLGHRLRAAVGARHAALAIAFPLAFPLAFMLAFMLAAPAGAADEPAAPASPRAGATADARVEALRRAHVATLGVRTRAVEDARSNEALGRERTGSGVVIGRDGLVLTISYLVLEADTVDVEIDARRTVPARVVANDLASGFALLQLVVPVDVEPVPLGRSADLGPEQPLLFSSSDSVAPARLLVQRSFSGSWEYHLDTALFTAPARIDHSGAGLFNADGELVGIGSLVIPDILGEGLPRLPANMFVPIDLLKPILAEMLAQGTSSRSLRAWLGINCTEAGGQVRVVRVNRDSPADDAGLEAGDRIVSLDGRAVDSLETLYKALWDGGSASRDVRLEILRGGRTEEVTVRTVDRLSTLRRSRGV